MPTRHYTHRCQTGGETAIDALAAVSQLPKQRLKDAMNKGAAWLRRGNTNKRLRRATTSLQSGDEVSLHYNPEILALAPVEPNLVADEKHYSVWHKPAGLLAQGTLEGDHCSLLRLAEQRLGRECFPVHRLDREAEGLMLIAHTGKAAAALSALFAREGSTSLRKLYRVEVRGHAANSGEIDTPLDGKPALTRYRLLEYLPASDSSVVEVELITGRKHQIRRHFAQVNHAVLGDPQYGTDNKDARGLQLRATGLAFECPLTRKPRDYRTS
ncbi:MAG TPA: RluA family pseudouridine synthase [Candidatus Acidoferrum sp.]|nr:RluA family pseudouridine synthase [Candidatus Acidoferrum sp.]